MEVSSSDGFERPLKVQQLRLILVFQIQQVLSFPFQSVDIVEFNFSPDTGKKTKLKKKYNQIKFKQPDDMRNCVIDPYQ